jgi:hypothetical protein
VRSDRIGKILGNDSPCSLRIRTSDKHHNASSGSRNTSSQQACRDTESCPSASSRPLI